MVESKKALRDVDAPLFNYFQALYYSFFSKKLYVDVGKRWRGFGFKYLFLLTCIATIPFSVRVIADFKHFYEEQVVAPLLKLPPITIQNGKVSLDKPMPYLIKNNDGQIVTIVDTTGKIKTITNEYPDLTTLITQDEFIYRVPSPTLFFSNNVETSPRPIYKQKLNDNINQVFDGKAWVSSSGILNLKYLSEAIIYPMIVCLFFSVYLVLILVFGLMGQFVSKLFFNFSLRYKQAVRLLTVSITPQLFLLLFTLAFSAAFPGLGIVLLLLFAGYFSFSILALKKESQTLVVS